MTDMYRGYGLDAVGNAIPIADPGAVRRGDVVPMAANAENFGGNPPAYYTPYDNRVDNSDFRHWVAQAGVGGNHGTQAYGGDRWILDSGTITGTANTNGLGYGSITLNGTIRQIIAEPQEIMTAFIGMISGTATVSYTYTDGAGELTITSAGGVLDWVMLLPDEWKSAPPYVPKGYAAELGECVRYYFVSAKNHYGAGHITSSSKDVWMHIWLPGMRVKPTIVSAIPSMTIRTTSGYSSAAGNDSPYGTPVEQKLELTGGIYGGDAVIVFTFSEAVSTNNTPVTVYVRNDAVIKFSADL